MRKFILLVAVILLSNQSLFSQVPSYVPSNGLVGYWPFSGNANDSSVNGNVGTVNGATLTTDRNGVANSAYSFNGSSSYISVPNNATFNFQNKFTFSYWINPTSLSGSQLSVILSKQISFGADQNGFNSSVEVGSYSNFRVQNGTSNPAFSLSTPNNSILINNWYHVVHVWTGTQGYIYINGLLVSQGTTTATVGNTTAELLIGKPNWSAGNVKVFNGKIDDVGIWNRDLTAQEIANLYTSCVSPAAPTGALTQTICASPAPTIASLTATGTGIQWYAAATGGTALATSTTLVNGTTYYASQTVSGCESTARLAVTVSFIDPQITASATTVCSGTQVNLTIPTQTNPFNIIDFSSKFNSNPSSFPGASDLTTMTAGNVTYNSVPFFISNWTNTFNSWNAYYEPGNNPRKLIIDVNNQTITELNLLANSFWGSAGPTSYASVELWNNTQMVYQKNLIGNIDIRDYIQNTYTNSINNTSTTNAWNNGTKRIDNQKIILPNPLLINKIVVSDTGGDIFQRIFVLAITSKSVLYTTTYLWSTGETTATISPTPTSTTTYWCDVTINGVTCRKSITITVNPNIAPTFTQVAAICNGATLAALPTTSTNSISGTWSPALNNTATTTYTFTPTAGQCATTATMTITVNTTATPTGTASQTFCATPAPTVADLTATGTGVQWYAVANGGTALATTTALVSGTTYYASQTLNACESTTRLAVTVTLNDPQITASATTVCSGTTVNLSVNYSQSSNTIINIVDQYEYSYNFLNNWMNNLGSWNSGLSPFAFDLSPNPNNILLTANTIWPVASTMYIRKQVNLSNFDTNSLTYSVAVDNGFKLYVNGNLVTSQYQGGYTFLWEYQGIIPSSFLNSGNNIIAFELNDDGASNVFASKIEGNFINTISVLWSTGETTATINPSPTATTTYWCDVTVNGVTCRKTMTITVNPNIAPTFTQVAAICNGATLAALPTTSTNSITGTWSPALNNTATTTYTFTPTAGQCATTATMTITVNPNIAPTFTQVAAICNGATLAALPTTSTNSITGTWSPALNNTATTTYTFTPTAGQCATTATMTITVNPNIAPTFTQVAPICNGATLAALPTTSTNSITGTWSPAINNTATTTYSFTPTAGLCATTATMTITVNPNITPAFSQVPAICNGATLAALPTTSFNNINGTWSPALNNTATTTYTFTPTSGQCATTATMTITVNPIITPAFTQVAAICSGADLSPLPTSSTNGINGTWSPAMNNTATTTYTFTPIARQCATTATMTITVNPNIAPTFTQVTPICAGATLAALPTTSNNGYTGTWSPAMNNTATTTYTFTPTAGLCATTATMTITVNPLPLPPTGTITQTFCANIYPTLQNIVVTPSNIKWYSSLTSATPLPITTALPVGATTYYATQYNPVTGCESNGRLAVVATVLLENTPSTLTDQTFCISDLKTLSDIKTDGLNIVWYTSSTGGTPLSNNYVLTVNQTLYAAIFNAATGCESPIRQMVQITIINCQLVPNNLLTLNGNSLNDNLNIENIENFPINQIEIYNRFGEIVWKTEYYNNGSNTFLGKANVSGVYQKDTNLPTGTYYFILKYYDPYHKKYTDLKSFLYINNNN
jgi:serine protease inhibitor